MKLLFSYVKQHKGLLLGALGLAVINQGFSLIDPQIFRLIIDNYASKVGELPNNVFIKGVLLLLVASVGVAFISRVAKNFQDYFANVATQKVGAQMYADAVSHSFSLPYSVFEDQRSGELLQKLQKARTDAQQFIINSINTVFFSMVGILIVVGYGFYVHWIVGLVFLLILPSLGFVTVFITRRIKDAQSLIVKESAELAGSTTETLRNVELVKSLGLEDQETERLNKVNEKVLTLELKKVKLVRILSFIQGTMINALRAGILLLLLWLVFRSRVSLGEFFTLYIYSFLIFNPLSTLGDVATNYQESRASMEALDEVLKMKPAPKPVNGVNLDTLKEIRFDNVSFSYEGGSIPAINNVDLTVKSGQSVAFVGPSGSGKTTIMKLILGLYQPTSGNVTFNGIDSLNIDYDDMRRRVGYVSQDTQLFAGTIRENLLFVRPDASDNECIEALTQAEAMSILHRAGRKGLDTKIGEGGIKVSGGERQRLAISRALLRNPELIIFDEATSSLDSITEKSITQTIEAITRSRPNMMTVMVAHRLSTIAHVDRIYVLERGTLLENGQHRELLNTESLYAALWREQGASA